ncbi:hypothetical protein ST47_g2721 [Ascochyta rabiei]|uniref:Heterokaryon incompatibility domain-containing protein n=1 Tax=Didymella rabiei TaxID=5454 RepID=A0A163J3V0_DIDRA|nr:hypothetical protein ST47_g2721 [Ascochyta rabiei]
MFCNKCQLFWSGALAQAQVPELITTCGDVQWSKYEVVLHSNLRELKLASASRCILCRIVHHTPTVYEHNQLLQDDTELLDVVLDIDPTKGPHPVLSVTFRETLGQSIRVPRLENSVVTLHRSVELTNNSTGSDGALHLASSWVENCILNHPSCRASATQNNLSFVPTRLLDTSNDEVRLVETKAVSLSAMDQGYVALSHCWGKVHIIRTLKENYSQHLSHIDFGDLSQTFQDAVHATRKLGFRYIWIDSLCIVQDDKDDWTAEAATMCDVYQYAILTIAAAHAEGGDVGCFKERDGLLQMPFIVDIPSASVSTKPAHVVFTSYGRSEGLGGPEPPLYGRAWVLQEQLLSPRMLVFDGSQLRWECLTTHASERSHSGGMSRHAGHQKAIRKAIMSKENFFSNTDFPDREFGARSQHLYWCSAVMDYTHRGMTQPKDRLVALAGIAQALERQTESDYFAGLFSRFLWAGMLWSIPHTREYNSTTQDAFSLEDNKRIRHTSPIAPSWSWASVTAPVVYASPTLTTLDPICTIISAHTTGDAAFQTGRIEIRGHVRKGYINAVYPFALQEAATRHRSHMMMQKPEGQKDFVNFKGRAFPPNSYFLFSKEQPKMPRVWGSDLRPTSYLTRSGNWRLVHGTFRPDEIISARQEITFLAIAQQHAGQNPPSLLHTHKPDDPLETYTVAIVPTGEYGDNTNKYRRVGYAVWRDCAWYGYNCEQTKQSDSGVERPGRWTRENGWEVDRGFFKTLSWWMKWDDLELYKRANGGRHVHDFESDALPGLKQYHKDVGIEEKTIVIV